MMENLLLDDSYDTLPSDFASPDTCLFCGADLDDDTNAPYCSAVCAIDAENDSDGGL